MIKKKFSAGDEVINIKERVSRIYVVVDCHENMVCYHPAEDRRDTRWRHVSIMELAKPRG